MKCVFFIIMKFSAFLCSSFAISADFLGVPIVIPKAFFLGIIPIHDTGNCVLMALNFFVFQISKLIVLDSYSNKISFYFKYG